MDPYGLARDDLPIVLEWYRTNYPDVTRGLESRIWPVDNLAELTGSEGANVCWSSWCLPIILIDSDLKAGEMAGTVAHECKHQRQSRSDRKKMRRQDDVATEAAKKNPKQVPWGPIHQEIYEYGWHYENLYNAPTP